MFGVRHRTRAVRGRQTKEVLAVLLAVGLLLVLTPVHGGVEELIQAVRDEDVAAVASIAATGVNLDEQHPQDGTTALYIASLRGKVALVAELVKAGANVDALNGGNKSSLGAAAHNDHTEILQMLIDAGADLDLPGAAGETAIFAAARSGAAASIRVLAAAGANLRLKGDNGQTPLHLAASAGHAEAAEALLDGGAFVNAVDAGEYTPLMMAAGFGHDAAVQVLVQAGAEVTLKCQTGLSALHLAAATNGGSKPSVDALLAAGADLNQKDNTGGTVLHLLASEGNAEMVKILLEKSEEFLVDNPKKALDVSIQDRRGRNATALAEAKENFEVVEAIEEYVERLHARFEEVKAQLEQLKASGRTDMTMDDFLEKAKADLAEERGEDKPEPAEKHATLDSESGAEKEVAPEEEVEEVIFEEDADTGGAEDAALDPEEQAMLERLLKKGYKIAKEPEVSTVKVPADVDPEVQAELSRRAAGRTGTTGSGTGKPRKTTDADVDAELSRRAAARTGTTGSATGKPSKTANADRDVDVELELQRRARGRDEL